MKNWWRKWSYEIPLALGDVLWEVLVVQFADFLSRLTLRRVLEFFAIVILALAFAQTFPIDLAFLFAGDALMYLEILVVIRLSCRKGASRAGAAHRRPTRPVCDARSEGRDHTTGYADQQAARAAQPCPFGEAAHFRSVRRGRGFWRRMG